MNNGAFGENFPYTNFHDLNLDWIIKEIKENRKTIDDFSEELEQMGVSIEEFREYLSTIDDEIQEQITEQVPIMIQEEIETGGFNDVVSASHKRRIIFIGDSYGQGWTPDGMYTPWCDICASILKLTSNDYYISAEGGAGFGKESTDGNQYIPNLVQMAYNNVNNPEIITDIIIALGYNDYLYYNQLTRISNGITNTMTKINELFPNARTHIYAIGFGTDGLTQYRLGLAYSEYKRVNNNYQYMNLSRALSNLSYFSSDGIHPSPNGQQSIALSIIRAFLNSEMVYLPQTDKAGSDITLTLKPTTTAVNFNDAIYITKIANELHMLPTSFKLITTSNNETFNLTGSEYIKLARIDNMADLIGYYTERPYDWYPGLFWCSVTGDSSFTTYQAKYTIAQDMANNDKNVYLWISIQGTSGGGLQNINNIYRFGIQAFNIRLPFITDR